MLSYFEDDEYFYIVMEKPAGYVDLFNHIEQNGVLSERLALVIFRNLLEAIQHCHSVGVFHRDIKEENVLVNINTGEIKLIDFGCATRFSSTQEYTHISGKWFLIKTAH